MGSQFYSSSQSHEFQAIIDRFINSDVAYPQSVPRISFLDTVNESHQYSTDIFSQFEGGYFPGLYEARDPLSESASSLSPGHLVPVLQPIHDSGEILQPQHFVPGATYQNLNGFEKWSNGAHVSPCLEPWHPQEKQATSMVNGLAFNGHSPVYVAESLPTINPEGHRRHCYASPWSLISLLPEPDVGFGISSSFSNSTHCLTPEISMGTVEVSVINRDVLAMSRPDLTDGSQAVIFDCPQPVASSLERLLNDDDSGDKVNTVSGRRRLPKYVKSSGIIICAWAVHGRICGKSFSAFDLRSHFQEFHPEQFKKFHRHSKVSVECSWKGCKLRTKSVRARTSCPEDSFFRHLETHLGPRSECPKCHKKFSRNDAVGRHMEQVPECDKESGERRKRMKV